MATAGGAMARDTLLTIQRIGSAIHFQYDGGKRVVVCFPSEAGSRRWLRDAHRYLVSLAQDGAHAATE
jgi:hypothetical protein